MTTEKEQFREEFSDSDSRFVDEAVEIVFGGADITDEMRSRVSDGCLGYERVLDSTVCGYSIEVYENKKYGSASLFLMKESGLEFEWSKFDSMSEVRSDISEYVDVIVSECNDVVFDVEVDTKGVFK